MNMAQMSFLDYLLGEFQSYQVGKPVARVQYSLTEQTRQRLAPLIKPPVALVIDVTGASPYPVDYQQVDAMYTTAMDRVRYAPSEKVYSFLNSVIDPVAANPVYNFNSAGFQFYPASLGSALLSYVGTPPTIIWASIPDANGIPVYDPGSSVDPVFYSVDCMEILSRALRMAGVNLLAQEVSQYANEITKTGQ